MKLILGVTDIPYTNSRSLPTPKAIAKARKKPPRPAAGSASTVTTGDVAEILEQKYHIMEVFVDRHEEQIGDILANSMAGELENVLMGAPPANDPFGAATSAIEAEFRAFLDRDEMAEASVPGVPTKAARMGVNHRLKKKRGAPRQSFIDTGLYQASMIAWVDK